MQPISSQCWDRLLVSSKIVNISSVTQNESTDKNSRTSNVRLGLSLGTCRPCMRQGNWPSMKMKKL